MRSLYLSKRLSYKIAIVIAALVLLAWAILTFFLLFNICTNAFIDSVSIDNSSEWSKYFLSKSGYATIRIRSRVASRSYVDDISTVGSNRSKDWFEALGFENIEKTKGVVNTIPDIFSEENSSESGLTMQHPMVPRKFFYYYSRTGVLLLSH